MITRREDPQLAQLPRRSRPATVRSLALIAQARLTEAELLQIRRTGQCPRCCTLQISTGSSCRSISVSPRQSRCRRRREGGLRTLPARIFLKRFGIAERSAAAYALTYDDSRRWPSLTDASGGLTACERRQARTRRTRERQGAFPRRRRYLAGLARFNRSKGQDMVDCMALLNPDAMTGHWEFTYGETRVKELIKDSVFPSWRSMCATPNGTSRVPAHKMFEKGGVKIAVLGQAFPYQPIANPQLVDPKMVIRDPRGRYPPMSRSP